MKRLIVFLIIYSIMFYPNFLPGDEQNIKSVLAVLDLTGKNVSKNEASIITGFIQESLFKKSKYKLVERTQVEKILKEQSFQADVCDITCAVKIGKQLAANKVLIGTVGLLGNVYTIQLKIIDIESNEIEKIESIRAKCDIGELPDYIEELVQKMMGSIIAQKVKEVKTEIKPEVKEETDKKTASEKIEIKPVKNVIEKPGLKKKKKKFPVFLVFVGVAAVVAAILFMGKKKKPEDPPVDNEAKVANEIYNAISWANISSGEFKMGDNFDDDNFLDDEPVHTVYLDSYSIAKHEMTFELYDKYCDVTGKTRLGDEGWGRGTRPVINVSWDEAKAFCDWLSQKTGKNIHLPTEAQWERAARGTDQRKYPWGNSTPFCSQCNFYGYDCYFGKSMPVGSYPSAGVNGLYDMAGNVDELCSDWYSNSYYSSSTYSNPQGPSSGSQRVTRGGNWWDDEFDINSYQRGSCYPDSKSYRKGFRIAMD